MLFKNIGVRGQCDSSELMVGSQHQLRIQLSGTGDSQRDSRKSIRANHSQLAPLFL